jgi:predicted nucleic acid-binding protein
VILFDTNVVSELMRPRPEPGVLAWMDAQDLPTIWLCAVNVLEVELGIELLDDSKRRLRLRQQWSQLLDQVFGNRVLQFDANAAARTAVLLALRRKQGRTIELRDAMIAGIALHHRCTLATRNVGHFDDCDVDLINPWLP